MKKSMKMTVTNHPSVKRDPEGDHVHVDDIPGVDEDGEDDDDRVPAADDIPEVDQS